MSNVREAAEEVVRKLPEDATWEELMYRLYVRKKIEAGLQDADEGHLVSQDEVERLFLDR